MPTSAPTQLGSRRVAPLWPQAVQRARRRSTSLDASAPQRMTGTACQRRVVRTFLAVDPHPRRRASQVAERGACADLRHEGIGRQRSVASPAATLWG